MRIRFMLGWAMALAIAIPALAQEPSVRQQVSDARVLSVTTTCFYGPTIDPAQAKRLCEQQARGQLLSAATKQLAADQTVQAAKLTPQELRAFVDSILVVTPLHEEARKVPEGRAVRLTLRGEEGPGKLLDKVAAFSADPQHRADALAATARHDRQANEARIAAIPFEGNRVFDAPAPDEGISAETAVATRQVVPGMSIASVKGLLGNPAAYHQSFLGAESYVCAGYGSLWMVFRDGVLACVRTRLEYNRRFDTDCHCGGHSATILNTD